MYNNHVIAWELYQGWGYITRTEYRVARVRNGLAYGWYNVAHIPGQCVSLTPTRLNRRLSHMKRKWS